jgi:hypothetical protein
MVSLEPAPWIGAFLVICVWSYYARRGVQNTFFRFAQSTAVGSSLGVVIVLTMAKNIDTLVITKVAAGNLGPIIPLLLGLLVYARFIPRREYLARIPVAIVVGISLGIATRAAIDAEIAKQIIATVNLPVLGVPSLTSFNSIISVLVIVAICYYFFFTLGPKISTSLQPVSSLGRYFLMAFFGAKFGATILTRMGFFMVTLRFLLFDWLGF